MTSEWPLPFQGEIRRMHFKYFRLTENQQYLAQNMGKASPLGHVVIYQLFIESFLSRLLVPLDINNNYPKYFFSKI